MVEVVWRVLCEFISKIRSMSFPPACPVGRLVGSERLYAKTRFENLS
ncbi:MAG: hypothetical protein L0922_02465 [Candidatus Mariimomonas ferrooxydans]